jgi:RNA 3'-terminal phosphate cyclase
MHELRDIYEDRRLRVEEQEGRIRVKGPARVLQAMAIDLYRRGIGSALRVVGVDGELEVRREVGP